MTIEQIAKTIIEMTGSKSKIVYQPLPTDDPKVRQPDITRARTLLGWEPKVSLEEGSSRRSPTSESRGASAYRVSFRYLIRCGWSAAAPRRRFRSAS